MARAVVARRVVLLILFVRMSILRIDHDCGPAPGPTTRAELPAVTGSGPACPNIHVSRTGTQPVASDPDVTAARPPPVSWRPDIVRPRCRILRGIRIVIGGRCRDLRWRFRGSCRRASAHRNGWGRLVRVQRACLRLRDRMAPRSGDRSGLFSLAPAALIRRGRVVRRRASTGRHE
jgi:hypothetical protein